MFWYIFQGEPGNRTQQRVEGEFFDPVVQWDPYVLHQHERPEYLRLYLRRPANWRIEQVDDRD